MVATSAAYTRIELVPIDLSASVQIRGFGNTRHYSKTRIIELRVHQAGLQTEMITNRRLSIVRAVAYVGAALAIVGFVLGISSGHYLLVTVSFVGAVVSFLSAFAAGFVADLLFQWRTSLVRLGAVSALVASMFGFGLGIHFEIDVLLIVSFVATLLSIAAAFNAPLITRLAFSTSSRPRRARPMPKRRRRR